VDHPNLESWTSVLADLPPAAQAQVGKLLNPEAPPPFFDYIFSTFEAESPTGRPGPAAAVLLENNIAVQVVCNPCRFSLEDAIHLSRAASRFDRSFDAKLLTRLAGPPRLWPEEVPVEEIVYVLEIIHSISPCKNLVMPLIKFVNHPNRRVRSKAAKLMARAIQNLAGAQRLMSDPDPRVRANMAEGLAVADGPIAREILKLASKDRHHRVKVTALLQLHRSGDQKSTEEIRTLAAHADPKWRVAAEWALKQIESDSAESTSGSI